MRGGKKTLLRVAIAPDSFKGSQTAAQAADRIERGMKKAIRGLRTVKVPMADGGEGTVDAMVAATGGTIRRRTVAGPLGRPVRAHFGLSGDGLTAIIEMAAASGLPLLRPAERNPWRTTTRGTGELIRAGLHLGVKAIVLGIGGSATNDGGCGMARALGVRFLDDKGRELAEGGGALSKLDRIDCSTVDPRLKKVRIKVACDVDNPLAGPKGASRIYGPQKGADRAMTLELDRNLRRLGRIVRRDLGIDIMAVPGGGAAGGLGAGLVAFAGAELRPGVDIVIETVQLRRKIRGCSLVITGEGRMDGQTASGKTPSGVARVARELNIPVIALCGSLGTDVHAVHAVGIDAFFSSLTESIVETDIASRGPVMLEECAEQVGRLLALNLRV